MSENQGIWELSPAQNSSRMWWGFELNTNFVCGLCSPWNLRPGLWLTRVSEHFDHMQISAIFLLPGRSRSYETRSAHACVYKSIHKITLHSTDLYESGPESCYFSYVMSDKSYNLSILSFLSVICTLFPTHFTVKF